MDEIFYKVCDKCQGEAHEIIIVSEKSNTYRCLACGCESIIVKEPKKPLTQQPIVTVKK